MEKDKGPELQIAFQEVTLALTSKKKDALKKIKYLKIKHTATGHLSESFNKPTKDKKTQEIKFDLRREKSACFNLQRHDANAQQNVNKCGIELEVMRNTERVTVAKFDVDDDRVDELIRREIHSESEKFQRIEVAYKVLKLQLVIENTVKNNHATLSNGLGGSKDEIEMKSMNGSWSCLLEGDDISMDNLNLGEEEPKFKPNSCIMVSFLSNTHIIYLYLPTKIIFHHHSTFANLQILILILNNFTWKVVGTTGRGKTTTMNLFTGNKVKLPFSNRFQIFFI